MKNIFSFIHTQLEQHIPVVLMTVVQQQGSSPGKTGFKMAVSANGNTIGSIGGGIMEHKLVEKSKRLLRQEQDLKPFLMVQNHKPDAKENRSGMICSGRQTVAFIRINEKEGASITSILDALEGQKKGAMELSENGLLYKEDLILSQHIESKLISASQWSFKEQIGFPDSLFIFGGGHVGLALSRLFSQLDFHVSIFDNRHDLSTLLENQSVHNKQTVDYSKVESLVPDGNNIYVVIMTSAHKSDEQVLKQLLGKNIRYLGMMGSAQKVKTIFEHFQQEGIKEEQLQKVYAPIGLLINSESPAEIAVSIAAQIIAVKNGAVLRQKIKG